jgi:hypothetical protein
MKQHLLHLSTACALLAATTSAQIALTHVGTVDLDSTANPANPEYIGSNPAAIAWDGTDIHVAGFNSSGGTANTAIVRISNALTAPTYGPAFGVLSTPSLRGYSGLDVQGGTLAAAYDDGAADPNGIAAYDANGNQLWAKNARGGSSAGFDPGFPGGNPALGSGVAWTTFGSGRRALQDAVTGADIWTTGDGMIILTSQGSFWRDIDFDDATGDLWLREGNNVIHAVRTGDNSVTALSVPFDPADADFVAVQNIAFVRTGGTSAVFFNDRSATAAGQPFAAVVKVIAPNGAPLVVDWGGFTAADGVGAYDFSYDPASGTLAILDFANRDAHIFAVAATCSTLTVTGSGAPGTPLAFAVEGAAPNAVAGLVLSGARGATAFNLGLFGTLELGLAQPLVIESIGATDPAGNVGVALNVPAGLSPRIDLFAQAFTVSGSPSSPTFDFCTTGVAGFGAGQ